MKPDIEIARSIQMRRINEVAQDLNIPEEILAKYDPDMSREAAQAVAVEISLELAGKLSDLADAYYFMTPFNRADLICEIIAGL